MELERLIAVAPLQERLRGQMMLALYRSGRQADALAAYRAACTLLRDELGLTPSAELRELECMILRHDPGLEVDRQDNAPASPVVCPFKGLAAFESSDAEFFCGRDRVISELVARLAEWPLVGILGPSGIGKSSLLRAGVLPALRAGALPGSAGWRQVLLRPGGHPCEELERALGEDIGQAVAGVPRGTLIRVAVDGLEAMLASSSRSQAVRCEFLEQLRERREQGRAACGSGLHVARRLLRPDQRRLPRTCGLLSRSRALVVPLDRDDLKGTIEQAGARAGLEVERPLVEALVEEVSTEARGSATPVDDDARAVAGAQRAGASPPGLSRRGRGPRRRPRGRRRRRTCGCRTPSGASPAACCSGSLRSGTGSPERRQVPLEEGSAGSTAPSRCWRR